MHLYSALALAGILMFIEEKMLNFISFGSGSSGNCYYIYTQNSGLLIDVGVGTRSLKKAFHDYGLRFVDGSTAFSSLTTMPTTLSRWAV